MSDDNEAEWEPCPCNDLAFATQKQWHDYHCGWPCMTGPDGRRRRSATDGLDGPLTELAKVLPRWLALAGERDNYRVAATAGDKTFSAWGLAGIAKERTARAELKDALRGLFRALGDEPSQ